MQVAIACLQETKLSSPDSRKTRSFLPSRLSSHCILDSIGAAGGVITAWDPNLFSLISVTRTANTLSVTLSFNLDGSSLHVTNIYAPSADKTHFFSELRSLSPPPDTPWILLGDFNLTRSPADKNNTNFSMHEASLFNDSLNDLGVIEIPLRDRAYTWSNKRETPTLVRLDRVFVDLIWSATYPKTTLNSLTRFTSDHVPLLVNVTTAIPRPSCFRYDRSWSFHEEFRHLIANSRGSFSHHDPAKRIVGRLKKCHKKCKLWVRRISPHRQRERDCKAIIDALDLLEEERPLGGAEAHLRTLAIDSLELAIMEKVAYWKQRSKLRVAVEGDENTKFFHVHASHRMRKNTIQLLEEDDREVTDHNGKATILLSYYANLLGSASPAS